MTTATRTRRTAGLSAEQRRARQDELLAALADGVLELTTSHATGVDWQVFHAWTADDPHFSGVITILDHIGAYVGTYTWITPTDQAADHSLTRIDWHRTGPWEPDRLGRGDAPIARNPRK